MAHAIEEHTGDLLLICPTVRLLDDMVKLG